MTIYDKKMIMTRKMKKIETEIIKNKTLMMFRKRNDDDVLRDQSC